MWLVVRSAADLPHHKERLLPTRIALDSDESLASYVERLAFANDLRPSQLLRLLRAGETGGRPILAFFDIKPDPALLAAIADIGGIAEADLTHATLARFGGGLPYRLDDLDPRRRHSYRAVVSQGWFPTTGTQACPLCLRERGRWLTAWRLPINAICPRHGTFLISRCAACGRRFRSHHYSPLRAVLGPNQPCGNPVSLRSPCRQSVLGHRPEPAKASLVAAAHAVQRALAGARPEMLGGMVDPRRYLAELRHLGTLLLHLASRPQAVSVIHWAEDLRAEARARSPQHRGPRWGYSPPQSAIIRGHVIKQAHQILTSPSVESAGALLAPWTALIADEPNGPSVWMVNRTSRTTTMDSLIRSATETRHHVGRRLSKRGSSAANLSISAVPHLLDEQLFDEIFADMLGGYARTRRLYASLSITRALTAAPSWAGVAQSLGLAPHVGSQTARAASKLMRVSPEEFTQAVRRGLQALPPNRDFRKREARVRTLAERPQSWFPRWRSSSAPARRLTSLSYAVTWMWCEVAQSTVDSSPGWSAPPSHRVKAGYRAFETKLPQPMQESLRTLVLTDCQI
ncbi:TniQ family protein [Mycobacterium sp. 29Ha]|uniref:TniQ family protein n=1 Tax=Mycobacterium sp. 29Ha TaxID=2939268 RepID=UPI0029393E75|nr:TniQ family protein [Mycobacterium sp. 29Ha]MDV3131366.1 TniQ family protein [Mycobacterium sp. 29Ha]